MMSLSSLLDFPTTCPFYLLYSLFSFFLYSSLAFILFFFLFLSFIPLFFIPLFFIFQVVAGEGKVPGLLVVVRGLRGNFSITV